MTRRILLLTALLLVLATLPARAVGTVVTTTREQGSAANHIKRFSVAWTSTAGGAVSANTFEVPAGRLLSVRFIPGSGGTQPTDLYDVTLVDTDSVDLLAGVGANLSNATSSIYQWDPPYFQDGSRVLDVVVANAGAAKTGTVVLLVQN